MLRSQFHCENLARGASPGHDSPLEPSPPASAPAPARFTRAASVRAASPSLLPPLEPLPPARRLEVTLRGTFRTESGVSGLSSFPDDDDEAAEADTEASCRAMTCTNFEQRFDSEESLRARMGFGVGERGATPSGRSSVPAIRGDGSLSAPPLAVVVDEGIELSSLQHSVEHHIFRILERSLRGPSRAASCEPQESFRASPSASPTPFFSGSPCPSPSPTRGMMEDLSLSVSIRLCTTRCGSSSAVLELVLDHSAECSEACGCRCWPSPEQAETLLLAYFARHSLLRLAATQPPVRVLLETLNADA